MNNKVFQQLAVCNPANPFSDYELINFRTKGELRTKLGLILRPEPIVFLVNFHKDSWNFIYDEPGVGDTLEGAPFILKPGIISRPLFERIWQGFRWTIERGELLEEILRKTNLSTEDVYQIDFRFNKRGH